MSEEQKATQMIKDLNNDYSSVYEAEPIPGLEEDNEIRAAVEYFEERVSAISKYSNDFFVSRAVERLELQFQKRVDNPNTSPILAGLYRDMITDLRYRVEEERKYNFAIGELRK